MLLLTGKRIHGYQWQELPISEEVIDRVHYLAKEEKQPALINGELLFEWNLGLPIEEERDHYLGEDMSSGTGANDIDLNVNRDELHSQSAYSEIPSNDFDDASFSSESEEEGQHELSTDPQEESIDEFFDGDSLSLDSNKAGDVGNANEENEIYEKQENVESVSKEEEQQLREERIVRDQSINDVNQGADVDTADIATEERTEDTGAMEEANLRRSGRSNKGVISRMAMDYKGKDYRSYTSKQFAQIMQQKKDQRKTRRALLCTLMHRMRKARKSPLQFFQLAVKTVFLSAQMNARKGIKLFGERAVSAMIKEFEQLDRGAFPGKPVVEPVDYHTITPEEIRMAMEAVSLIKEKKGGVVKGCTCANGSKQKKYLKHDESIASPTTSTDGMFGTFMIDAYEGRVVGISDIPGAYLHAEMEHTDHRVLLVLRDEFVDIFLCL